MHSPEMNGVASTLWNIGRILSSLGNDVFFLTCFSSENLKDLSFYCQEFSRIKVISISSSRTLRSIFWSVGKRIFKDYFKDIQPEDIDVLKFAAAAAMKLKDLIRSEKIDYVLFSDSFMEYAYFLPFSEMKTFIHIACPRYLFQKIGLVDTPVNSYFNRLEKSLVPAADILLAPSKAMSNIAADYYGVELNRIRVIPNPIDVDLFCPNEDNSQEESIIKLCFAGRFSYEKGAHIIIKILPSLLKRFKNLQFSVVGNSGKSSSGRLLIDELKEKIAENNASERFFYYPKIHHYLMPDFYRSNHIFISPTLFDSFGNTIVEAQSCGLPVVVNTVGGVPEIVKDGETGFLINNNDEMEFLEKIEKLIIDTENRKKMSKKAREYVLELFSFKVVSEQLKNIIC